jgi:hypothetical protein
MTITPAPPTLDFYGFLLCEGRHVLDYSDRFRGANPKIVNDKLVDFVRHAKKDGWNCRVLPADPAVDLDWPQKISVRIYMVNGVLSKDFEFDPSRGIDPPELPTHYHKLKRQHDS